MNASPKTEPLRHIPDEVRCKILRRLRQTESEHRVRILFAIESGSRAWGFASQNSDYDIRFVYSREPSWYQAVDLEERRDVIEYPIVDEIDLNGWDVRKALRLFWKSNPTFIEWIFSPITYLEQGLFRQGSLELLPKIYSPIKGYHHYLSMATSNFRRGLQEPMVRLKQYFYVLRPLLAARWIAKTGQPAPIEFEVLLSLIEEDSIRNEIHALIEQKRQGMELGLSPANPLLNDYIENAILKSNHDIPKGLQTENVVEQLNPLFHRVLKEYQAHNTASASASRF